MQMKEQELYYRKPRNESFSPQHRTKPPTAWGTLNGDLQDRVVMLYTSGQSIEAISREISKARHFVVHVLQSRGIFGKHGLGPDPEEPRTESDVVKQAKKQLVDEEQKNELERAARVT